MAAGYSMDRVAVKKYMKRWAVRGVFEHGDLLSFAMDGDCSSNLARVKVPTSEQEQTEIPILLDVETGNYYFTAAFQDASDVFGKAFTVCYRSRSDLRFYPTPMSIRVLTIEEIGASSGSSDMAVIKVGKDLLFGSEKNFGVQNGDRFALTTEATCTAFAMEAATVDELLSVPVLFDENAASFYNVCYQFVGQPWVMVHAIRVYDVLSLEPVCEDCSEDVSVMYTQKEYTFRIHGEYSPEVPEFAKWVYGDEGCDGQAALLSEVSSKVYDDVSGDLVSIEQIRSESSSEVSSLLTGSTERVSALRVVNRAAAMTFLQSSVHGVNNRFSLCYKFGDEPYKFYPDVHMTVVGIDSVSSNKGMFSTLVAGVPETWTVEGFGFSDNDVLRLVEGTSCEEGVVKEVPVYASSPMEAYVKDLVVESAADKVYTLCWKFDTEAYTFMSKYTVMVNDVTSATPTLAVAGVPSVFSYEGVAR